MTQVSYYEPKKGTPGALALVIALHAAGIAGLVMWKIDVPVRAPEYIDIFDVPLTKDPDPIPPEPQVDPQPSQPVRSEIASVPPVVETPMTGSEVATVDRPIVPEVIFTVPGTAAIPTPAPPRIEQSASAKGDVRRLFSVDDYPAAAIRRDETGSVRARLAIGANGNVTGCSVVESSGSSTLDQKTCQILKARARFTPAKDSNGQPTTDSYVTPSIVWRLEDRG